METQLILWISVAIIGILCIFYALFALICFCCFNRTKSTVNLSKKNDNIKPIYDQVLIQMDNNDEKIEETTKENFLIENKKYSKTIDLLDNNDQNSISIEKSDKKEHHSEKCNNNSEETATEIKEKKHKILKDEIKNRAQVHDLTTKVNWDEITNQTQSIEPLCIQRINVGICFK
jgi:hypothetical protein